jgi:hypothetical protein
MAMTDSTELAQQLDGIIGAIRHAKLQHVATLGALDDAEQRAVAALELLTGEPEPLPEPPKPVMMAYSQRDPRWKDTIYAGGLTFGQAGCLVTCVAMIASLAGYEDTPPQVAEKLREANVFRGARLDYPARIPDAYPLLRWNGIHNWRNVPADISILADELSEGPVIIEVEFVPGGAMPPDDQHFVVGEVLVGGGDDEADLIITDSWDGSQTRLLERYALDNWSLARSVYRVWLLRVAEE